MEVAKVWDDRGDEQAHLVAIHLGERVATSGLPQHLERVVSVIYDIYHLVFQVEPIDFCIEVLREKRCLNIGLE